MAVVFATQFVTPEGFDGVACAAALSTIVSLGAEDKALLEEAPTVDSVAEVLGRLYEVSASKGAGVIPDGESVVLSITMLGRQFGIVQPVTALVAELKRSLVQEQGIAGWPDLFVRDKALASFQTVADLEAVEVLCVPGDLPSRVVLETIDQMDDLAFRLLPSSVREQLSDLPDFFTLVPDALRIASPAVQGCKEIVLRSVARQGDLLLYASELLRDDAEVVAAAVSNSGTALGFASDRLRGDAAIVTRAVQQRGYAISHASMELRNDREMMIMALATHPRALQFASVRLADNPHVVRYAVYRDGMALKSASARLRDDEDIVKIAVSKCFGLLRMGRPGVLYAIEGSIVPGTGTPDTHMGCDFFVHGVRRCWRAQKEAPKDRQKSIR